MKQIKRRSSQKKLVAMLIIIALLIVGGGITYAIALHAQKNQTTKEQNNTNSNTQNTTKETLNPPSSDQINAGNQTKQENIGSDSPSNSNPTVSLTPYRKDGYTIKIDSTINSPLSDGSCTLTVTNGDTVKVYNSGIQQLANYSTCKGFEIPISDLGSGNWLIDLKIKSGSYSMSATSSIDT